MTLMFQEKPLTADDQVIRQVVGSDLHYYVQKSIEENDSLHLDKAQSIVSQVVPVDANEVRSVSTFASLVHYHSKRTRDTVHTDDVKLALMDLTPDQIMSSYALGFHEGDLISSGAQARKQLVEELRISNLLEMTGWMANNLRFGCAKCAPFLTR